MIANVCSRQGTDDDDDDDIKTIKTHAATFVLLMGLFIIATTEDQTPKIFLKSFKQSLLRQLTSAAPEDMPENDVEERNPGIESQLDPQKNWCKTSCNTDRNCLTAAHLKRGCEPIFTSLVVQATLTCTLLTVL
ncbi:hypothetical protein PoB_006301700 [Plakobranchus ocellatus]|uniref:Uncharacterized protein n=1 Tax=Plakobranchus ocellatus TaxID=259542 RepID=A0AAV4CX79_9GAST|nr:hypothetical protein PoB_006301700 [Plakobranchus ocellatus]